MKKFKICMFIDRIRRKLVYVCLGSMLLLSACGEQNKNEFHTEAKSENLSENQNEEPDISLKKDDFIKEWKSILGTVISGLKKCGYDVTEIKGMKQLIDQYKGVIGNGILYQK